MKTLGRPREFDRQAALQAAMLVFWRKGFLASSMNDLCEAMGIRSPSLYAAFGSKEDLYVEAVDFYNAGSRERVWNHLDDGPSFRAGMQAMLLAAAGVLSGSVDEPTGCLVMLAAGEDCPDSAADITRLARSETLDTLRAALERASAAGELPRGTDIDGLSRFFLGVVQGMAIQARDGASLDDLQGMAKAAMAAWPAKAAR